MKTIVVKYGGSSLETTDRIKIVADNVISLADRGSRVVVVVSAMGKTTDELLGLSQQIAERPPGRELGMLLSTGETVSSALLAMAIQAAGRSAVALTGPQCGIETDAVYDNAKIEDIDTGRIKKHLERGDIVVVAGYQGRNKNEITVLGRGGSDATAAALAAALRADKCHIYSDVPGVFTIDPGIVNDAALLDAISYEDMLELAASGAQIMMGRAVEIARRYGIDIVVSSSLEPSAGTIITGEEKVEKVTVTGVAVDKNVTSVHIYGIKNNSLDSAAILRAIAEKKINIKILAFFKGASDGGGLSIVIDPREISQVEEILEEFRANRAIENFQIEPDVAKVAIVGSGIAGNWGIASQMFTALAENGIEILLSSTSEIKIAAIIPKDDAETAAAELHSLFNLKKMKRHYNGVCCE